MNHRARTRFRLCLVGLLTASISCHSASSVQRQPRLAAAIETGSMGDFIPEEAERRVVLDWVSDGAPRSSWSVVSEILEARCVSCHDSKRGLHEMLALDSFASASESATTRPILLEKIKGGTMGKYLESEAEQRALLGWIESGSSEADFAEIQPILDARCVSCHNPETGVVGIVPLDVYPSPALKARILQ